MNGHGILPRIRSRFGGIGLRLVSRRTSLRRWTVLFTRAHHEHINLSAEKHSNIEQLFCQVVSRAVSYIPNLKDGVLEMGS